MANRTNKNIHEIIDYAIKSKRFIGGLGKLEKDGSLSKINGQVLSKRTTRNGDVMIVIDNFLGKNRGKRGGKRWQTVLVKNLVSFNENHWTHSRVA